MRENAGVMGTGRARVVIVGGGPGGYEAALVAAGSGADVTVVEADGLGGAAVLTDVVPSKTLIATAEVMSTVLDSAELGVRVPGGGGDPGATAAPGSAGPGVVADLGVVNRRVKALAAAQSEDIRRRLDSEGVRLVPGRARLDGPGRVVVAQADGGSTVFEAGTVLVATGARPRELPDAPPDGERILTWKQVYDLDRLPERLVVVGSGVTGAEFASAYRALGSQVVLLSSVIPEERENCHWVAGFPLVPHRGEQALGRNTFLDQARASLPTADPESREPG